MTHQIPPHLAFCTPGQNQKAEQGTNPETLKGNKQTQKQLHISQRIWRNEKDKEEKKFYHGFCYLNNYY